MCSDIMPPFSSVRGLWAHLVGNLVGHGGINEQQNVCGVYGAARITAAWCRIEFWNVDAGIAANLVGTAVLLAGTRII